MKLKLRSILYTHALWSASCLDKLKQQQYHWVFILICWVGYMNYLFPYYAEGHLCCDLSNPHISNPCSFCLPLVPVVFYYDSHTPDWCSQLSPFNFFNPSQELLPCLILKWSILISVDTLPSDFITWLEAWFTVAVSAADSAGTETDRSRRLGSVSGDTRKTLQRKLKKFWKNHDKS